MTICIECMNFIEKNNPMCPARCSANFDVGLDLVYGEYKTYKACVDINKGNCRNYLKKDSK